MGTDSPFKNAIQPQAIFPISTTHTQVVLLAVHHIVVHATIRECFEPYPVGRASARVRVAVGDPGSFMAQSSRAGDGGASLEIRGVGAWRRGERG